MLAAARRRPRRALGLAGERQADAVGARLDGRLARVRVAVVDNGYGGSTCLLYDDENNSEVTVVQPNEDGTYWRKVVRNKMYRTREKRNVDAAKKFIQKVLPDQDHDVMSSYGPYISTVGQVMGVSTKALPFKAEDTTKLTKSR